MPAERAAAVGPYVLGRPDAAGGNSGKSVFGDEDGGEKCETKKEDATVVNNWCRSGGGA